VLDGARYDAIKASAEHPRVVAHPTVQGVGDHRVAAELEAFDAGRLVEADFADDAAALIDREERVELLLGGALLKCLRSAARTFSLESLGILSSDALDLARWVRMSSSSAGTMSALARRRASSRRNEPTT
jgi:hypothetical protein